LGRLSEASAGLYVRNDTDQTTIVSPHAHATGRLNDAVDVEAGYTMDSWTSASIDIRTAATRAVHELRHELDLGAGYERHDVRVAGAYRYSSETDYESHGGVFDLALDLAQNNTTLAVSAFGGHDTVGRSGDPSFARPQNSVGARFALTQVLDPKSLFQLAWETTAIAGFQASPYRWVAIGADGGCAGASPFCIPEHEPDTRFRHAASLRVKRALGEQFSLAFDYRFYADSWGVSSQTLRPVVIWLPVRAAELALEYRYYTQDEADFYRPRYYDTASSDGFVTRDRKLSAFFTHGVALSYSQRIALGATGPVLTAGLRMGWTHYRYLAFVGLSQVDALDASVVLGLDGF
jgi:hypothetical protein